MLAGLISLRSFTTDTREFEKLYLHPLIVLFQQQRTNHAGHCEGCEYR